MEDDSNVQIDMEKKKVTLSMILKWYSVDFGKNNQEVLEFIVNYLTGVRISHHKTIGYPRTKIGRRQTCWLGQ